MLVFAGLFLIYFNTIMCEQNCGTLVKSTCSDESITPWNRYNMGDHLRDWVKSIQEIRPDSGNNKNHFLVRKTLIQFEGKTNFEGRNTFIQLIVNNMCSEQKHVGPLWKKASTFSGTQFHDGFLYGVENNEGKLTGNLYDIYLKKNKQCNLNKH